MAKSGLQGVAAGWHTDIGDTPEWCWLSHGSRPNGLLIGPSQATHAVVRQLEPSFRTPVLHWPRDGEPWTNGLVPSTLILHQASALGRDDQQSLLVWLSDAGRRVQVISLDSGGLYLLVQNGAFLEALYYRLNCVVVDCGMATVPTADSAWSG
jgi:hypothetical protein